MADHFQGSESIELQPGDVNVPVRMKFNAATASTANDGSMPYGSTVKTVVFSIKNERGINATSFLRASSALSGNTVIAYLKYSTGVADGRYFLTGKVSFSLAGSTLVLTKEFDLRRIFKRNE